MDLNLPFSSEIAERFDGLFQYLSRKYQVQQKNIKISKHIFKLIVVKNIEVLLDDLATRNPKDKAVIDEQLPYWAEIWPSSIALSKFILENSDIQKGCNAIELGCGMGLVSLAAATKGIDIVLSDYQEDALRFTELNWLMNLGRSPVTRLMDWRNPQENYKYDLILASDIVYEKRFFQPISDLFKKLLKPEGLVLLSEPNRKVATDFFKVLLDEGFLYEQNEIRVRFNNKNHRIIVYKIRN
jgi:predicted nicotinamide N-methyase